MAVCGQLKAGVAQQGSGNECGHLIEIHHQQEPGTVLAAWLMTYLVAATSVSSSPGDTLRDQCCW